MAVNLQNVTLPTGAYTPTQPQQVAVDSAAEVVENLLKTPALPTGTTISPTLQQIQTGELLATPGVSGTVAAGIPTAAVPTVTGAAAPTTTAAAAPTAYATGQYAAGQTGIAATSGNSCDNDCLNGSCSCRSWSYYFSCYCSRTTGKFIW